MIFQPADKFNGALSEPLDGFLENGESASTVGF
jgi:hypothetical protein